MDDKTSDLADWTCPSCHRVNSQKEYCPACATRIGIFCPNCDMLTPIRLPFCHACGREKEKVYQEQKYYAVKYQKQHVDKTHEDIRQTENDLTFPTVLIKGFFGKGFSCGRLIGLFLIFSAVMLFVLAVSFASTESPSLVETVRSYAWGVLLLGIAFMTIPPVYGYAAERRRQLASLERSMPYLRSEISRLEQIDFVEWCKQKHIGILNAKIAAKKQEEDEEERKRIEQQIREDRELENFRERMKQWDRDYEQREREKQREEEDD